MFLLFALILHIDLNAFSTFKIKWLLDSWRNAVWSYAAQWKMTLSEAIAQGSILVSGTIVTMGLNFLLLEKNEYIWFSFLKSLFHFEYSIIQCFYINTSACPERKIEKRIYLEAGGVIICSHRENGIHTMAPVPKHDMFFLYLQHLLALLAGTSLSILVLHPGILSAPQKELIICTCWSCCPASSLHNS